MTVKTFIYYFYYIKPCGTKAIKPSSVVYCCVCCVQSQATVNAKAKADEYEAQKNALQDHLNSLKVQTQTSILNYLVLSLALLVHAILLYRILTPKEGLHDFASKRRIHVFWKFILKMNIFLRYFIILFKYLIIIMLKILTCAEICLKFMISLV